ncbi:MAG: PilZ domain-containing protein [Thermodesulfobacteriota bacterium]
MGTEERRRHPRFALQIDTRVITESGDGKRSIIECVTANISSGGLFIKTDTPLPMASKIQMELFLSIHELKILEFIPSMEHQSLWPGERNWYSASGFVVWCRDEGMGVMFDKDYREVPMTGRKP